MPLITSLVLEMRPNILVRDSPTSPHQFAFMPIFRAGWARMAVVHSTVWILAMRAQLMSRALSKIWSPLQSGCARRTMSQMALCSFAKSVCSISIPIHQLLLNPVSGFPSASRGRNCSRPSLVSSSLPSSCMFRKVDVTASLDP